MSFKFNAEDFNKYICGHECPNTANDCFPGFEGVEVIERSEYIAAICNALLEAHLKTLPRVLVRKFRAINSNEPYYYAVSKPEHDLDREVPITHTALLWDVKEIKEK